MTDTHKPSIWQRLTATISNAGNAVATNIQKPGNALGNTIIASSNVTESQLDNYHQVGSLSEAIKVCNGPDCTVKSQELVRSAAVSEIIYNLNTLSRTDMAASTVDLLHKTGKSNVQDPYTVTIIPKNGKMVKAMVILNERTREAEVAYKGTQNYDDVVKDAKAKPTLVHKKELIKAHTGFKRNAEELMPEILDALKGDIKKVTFSGHSLGAATAQIATILFHKQRPDCPVSCITFGSPRVGNAAFAKALNNATKGNNIRVVQPNDPVVDILPQFGEFTHASRAIVVGRPDNHVYVSNSINPVNSVRTTSASLTKATIDLAQGHAYYYLALASQVRTDEAKLQEAAAKIGTTLAGDIGTIAHTAEPQAQQLAPPPQGAAPVKR